MRHAGLAAMMMLAGGMVAAEPPRRRREIESPQVGDLLPLRIEKPGGGVVIGQVRVVEIQADGGLVCEPVEPEGSLKAIVEELQAGPAGQSMSGRMSGTAEIGPFWEPEKAREARRASLMLDEHRDPRASDRLLSESTIPARLRDRGMLLGDPPELEAIRRDLPAASGRVDLHRHREAGLAEKRKRERRARKAGRKARKR